jgi:hypothetical protein
MSVGLGGSLSTPDLDLSSLFLDLSSLFLGLSSLLLVLLFHMLAWFVVFLALFSLVRLDTRFSRQLVLSIPVGFQDEASASDQSGQTTQTHIRVLLLYLSQTLA